MRSALSSFIKSLQERAVLHPSAATLVASLDGALELAQNTRVTGHLSRCPACRQRLEELQIGLGLYEDALAPLPSDFSVEEGLARFRAAIQSWNDQRSAGGLEVALSPAICERLVAELSIYMGLRAARAMLQRCNRPGAQPEDLTALVEPVLTDFFGRQTGSAVTTKVVGIWNGAQSTSAPSRSSS